MVAVISIDAYLFLAFSDLSCHIEDTQQVFSGCTVPSDTNKTELESSDQEASPSVAKNTGVVLVSSQRMEVRPYSYFRWCGYF